jgi:hypothetical protein
VYRSKLKSPTVETCRYRALVRAEGDAEAATCRLLAALLSRVPGASCRVRRDACDACCQSFPPSQEDLNPVIASLVYQATRPSLDAQPPPADAASIEALHQKAARQLGIACADGEAPIVRRRVDPAPLAERVPRPARRCGRRVRRWAIGVTTSPRVHSTLEECLEGLAAAGWERPHLFVDAAVRVPERFRHLPGTCRDEKAGAWPNYYLAMVELLMREPRADAFLVLQDDVVLCDRPDLRAYLEHVLWPGRSSALVSLYCAEGDTRTDPGWHRRARGWTSGAHALVFPPPLAKAFVTDPLVFGHRWAADPARGRCVLSLVDRWTRARRFGVWFPTPSLAQHVGDSSTLWPSARTRGSRHADRFADDPG